MQAMLVSPPPEAAKMEEHGVVPPICCSSTVFALIADTPRSRAFVPVGVRSQA
jgi:hypothetical protein